jgi:hypothetical protein
MLLLSLIFLGPILKPPAERVKVRVRTSYGIKVLTILHPAKGAMGPQKAPRHSCRVKKGVGMREALGRKKLSEILIATERANAPGAIPERLGEGRFYL